MNSGAEAKGKGKAVLIENDTFPTPLALGPPSAFEQVNLESGLCFTKILLENYSNFNKTGPPSRFMYYHAGSWIDFPTEVVEHLRTGFDQGKPMIEVQTRGIGFLFDMYRMLQVNLKSGENRSISWTDINGKCFFPKSVINEFGPIDNSDISPNLEVLKITEDPSSKNPKIRVEIRIGGGPNMNPNPIPNSDPIPSSSKRKRGVFELGTCSKLGFGPLVLGLPRWPNTKLLVEREPLYKFVKDKFMSGIGINDTNVKITAIHQCLRIDRKVRARSLIFFKQVQKTALARGGEANVTFGWHGTSVELVKSILQFGFVRPSRVFGSQAHGIGVYLSPLSAPHTSALLSEVDDYGDKHVILCRVVLGRREEIAAGSEQLHPSSGNFDIGVDDIRKTKWYIVWPTHMHSHILPEFVVSYKYTNCLPGENG